MSIPDVLKLGGAPPPVGTFSPLGGESYLHEGRIYLDVKCTQDRIHILVGTLLG
jgi:hypothetical protein